MINEQKQRELYADLMDEVKVRIECIDSAAQGKTGYPLPIVREFCYLQLRMLCELIALASLVAHGDIKFLTPKEVRKAYKAGEILERLEELRPHFYPCPCQIIRTANDNTEIRGVNPSPMPKSELIRLYGQCHRHLHRGNLKNLMSGATPIDMVLNVPEIIGWAQKINDLLSAHVIAIDEKNVIGCILRNIDDNLKIQVFQLKQQKSPLSDS